MGSQVEIECAVSELGEATQLQGDGAEWSNKWNFGARRSELISAAWWIEFRALRGARLRGEGVCERTNDGRIHHITGEIWWAIWVNSAGAM